MWLFPLMLEYILYVQYGGPIYNPYTLWMWTRFDFSNWESNQGAINVFAIILMSAFTVTVMLAAVGIFREVKKNNKDTAVKESENH